MGLRSYHAATAASKLYVEERGDGEPVLLLQGLGQGCGSGATRSRVSRPGSARSRTTRAGRAARPGPTSRTRSRTFAEDSAEVLAGRAAHVVGALDGRLRRADARAGRPELVRSLVLAGTGAGGPGRVPRPDGGAQGFADALALPLRGAGRRTAAVHVRAGLDGATSGAIDEILAARLEHPTPDSRRSRRTSTRATATTRRASRSSRSRRRRSSSTAMPTGSSPSRTAADSRSACRTRATSSSPAPGTTCRSRSPTRSSVSSRRSTPRRTIRAVDVAAVNGLDRVAVVVVRRGPRSSRGCAARAPRLSTLAPRPRRPPNGRPRRRPARSRRAKLRRPGRIRHRDPSELGLRNDPRKTLRASGQSISTP